MSADKKDIKVSAVILAKDEEGTIAGLVAEALRQADETLVVDGRSKDNTARFAQEAGATVLEDNGRGKGDGYRAGLAAAKGEVIVFLDADGSHDPKDIPRLAAPVLEGSFDLVIGSRWKGGSDDVHPTFNHLVRDLGGNLLSIIISRWFDTEITDCLHGYRALKKDAGLKLNLTADDFDIEHEMIIKALKKGYKIGEVAVHEYSRQAGKSKLPTFGKGHMFIWRLVRELLRSPQ
jgi:dolichol-phosphate hexosyltransferase